METPVYEMLFLIPQGLEDEKREKVLSETRRYIEQRGEVYAFKHWKDRRLAYPIKHITEGSYYLTYFHIPPKDVADLSYRIRNIDGILRIMINRIDEIYRKAKKPMPFEKEKGGSHGAE